jgi:large subunit ribosomal protein L15
MKLHEMTNTVPRQARKRVGRGNGNNWGRTCGRGEKGQMSRSGAVRRPYFEGGQIPFFRRLPKKGFTSRSHKFYAVVNIAALQERFEDGETVCPQSVASRGLIGNIDAGLKILANGKLNRKLTVKAYKFSAAVRAAIETAGGTCEEIS